MSYSLYDKIFINDSNVVLNGNVGIGTTNPIYPLDIFNNDANGCFIRITGDSSNRAGVILTEGDGGKHLIMEYDGNGVGSGNYFTMYAEVDGWAGKGSGFTYIPSTGYVGIGTTIPITNLDVAGSATGTSLQLRSGFASGTPDSKQILFTYDNRSYDSTGYAHSIRTKHSAVSDVGNSIGFWLWNTSTTNGSTIGENHVMSICGNNCVGIGTTSPSYALDVVSTEASVWNMRVYNPTSGTSSDDYDCKMVVQATSAGAEVQYSLYTPYILWHIQSGEGNDEHLDFAYDDNPGSSPSYNSGTVAGYITKKSDNTSLNFTGQHRTFIKNIPYTEASNLEGLIVSANTDEYIKMSGGIEYGLNAITINESLPIVNISSIPNDKSCFGVISTSEDPDTREDKYGSFVAVFKKEEGDTRVYINSLGEGAIWITNINGNLESGDYITTSSIKGYGMKQDSEFLANYTVAKITMNCDFNPSLIPKKQILKQLGIKEYYYKLININENEYNSLPEKYRKKEVITVSQEEYDNMNTTEQSTYINLSKTVYYAIKTSKILKNGYQTIEIEELVNVLDEHGQIQWVDTNEVEPKYKTRYVNMDGDIITEEEYTSNIANNIPSYKAAFVGCTYHCG